MNKQITTEVELKKSLDEAYKGKLTHNNHLDSVALLRLGISLHQAHEMSTTFNNYFGV